MGTRSAGPAPKQPEAARDPGTARRPRDPRAEMPRRRGRAASREGPRLDRLMERQLVTTHLEVDHFVEEFVQPVLKLFLGIDRNRRLCELVIAQELDDLF